MQEWVISFPAWNDLYRDVCTQSAIPAIKIAIKQLPADEHRFMFVVHTDQRGPFVDLLKDFPVTFLPIPGGTHPFRSFIAAHQEILRIAPVGSNIVLLNADIIVSREILALAHQLFGEGYRALASVGTRALFNGNPVPIGANAGRLSEWAWSHRHPIAQECMWGTGRTHLPTVVFFHSGENAVQHCFHLCPIVMRKDERPFNFASTIDDDLLASFSDEEIYIAKDLECSLAELSPITKRFDIGEKLSVDLVSRFGAKRFRPHHLASFEHGLLVSGDRAAVDCSPAHAILSEIRRLNKMPGQPERPRRVKGCP